MKLPIGEIVKYNGKNWVIVGASCMLNEENGEPEWKITKQIQEIALAEPFDNESWQKPFWISVKDYLSGKDKI